MRVRTLITAALLAFLVSPRVGQAAGPVDLQLVLAVDISRSMDATEQRVQRDGYVSAFRNSEVQSAITSGPYGRIAVTYIEWSSAFYQRVVVPWRVLASDEETLAFAQELARAPLSVDNRTSISAGLSFAASLIATSGIDSDRRTIDVSGDGPNNEGQSLTPVRDRVLRQGININGLPILLNPTPTLGAFGAVSLADYYQDCVIGGPGAFVVPIRTLQDFEPATRRKLVLEIASIASDASLVIPVVDIGTTTPRVDCTLAEKAWEGVSP